MIVRSLNARVESQVAHPGDPQGLERGLQPSLRDSGFHVFHTVAIPNHCNACRKEATEISCCPVQRQFFFTRLPHKPYTRFAAKSNQKREMPGVTYIRVVNNLVLLLKRCGQCNHRADSIEHSFAIFDGFNFYNLYGHHRDITQHSYSQNALAVSQLSFFLEMMLQGAA